jgi:UDP-N-acetylmuramate dehydrogenase
MMKDGFIREIRTGISGGVLLAEPLARHTTYRVGGPAEVLASPATREEAAWLCGFAKRSGAPLTVLGAGSNVIAPDAGIAGVVLHMRQPKGRIEFMDGWRVSADAGVMLEDLVRAASSRGYGGLEPLAGVPGTVGGAVVMNAGTRDTETASLVASVDALDADGKRRVFAREDLAFGYRYSVFKDPGRLVLGAEFRLGPADPAESLQRIDAFVADRWKKYPMDGSSAGSVFKRPPGDYPGRLIEAAGCKGMRVGGALVSERHANFIVNTGTATAADIVELVERVRRAVFEKTGIRLELEQIILQAYLP